MIVFILPQFSGGGAERVVINLLIELYRRGHRVGIVVFNKNGPLLSIIPNSIPIYNLDTKTLSRSIVPLVKFLRRLQPRVVFSTFGYINIPLLAIRWILPKRTNIWIREANLPSVSLPNNPYPRLMIFLYRLLYRKSDRLFCTSAIMKNEFISNFLVPDAIIDILPNPVNIKKIRSLILPVKRFDNGGVCYVASGRLAFQKGFDRLLKWFSTVDNQSSTLVILGDGGSKSELIKQSIDLCLNGRVKFVGFCSNPWQWYAGADVFLISSRWEGMPNSALESLACGTPVIATAESGGVSEICTKRNRGALIVVHTSDDFIKAMNNVFVSVDSHPRVSLLSEIYNTDNVVNMIENWLDTC